MILAATNPDTGAFGLAYVASVLAFVASLAVFCGVSVWLLGRFAAWHQDRHDNRALTDGDRHILRAIEQWSFGDQGVPGDYRKATVAHLLSFGYSVGALSTDAKLPHEDREDVEDEDDDAGEPTASDEGEEADTVGVTCQVCGKKSKALSDGLCKTCAKNAGVRHLGDDAAPAETA